VQSVADGATGEGAGVPFGRCVIYSYTGDLEQIVKTTRAGILPIFQGRPGFIAYAVMPLSDVIVSMSAWNSEADAKGADEAATQWVEENLKNLKIKDSYMGEYAWVEFTSSN
jgi:hypothetical protein